LIFQSKISSQCGIGGRGAHVDALGLNVELAGQAEELDQGLPGIGYLNGLFATVTVCVPGSLSDCQTIDHVLVDTGSTGLRLLGSVLTLNLPVWNDESGSALAECYEFVGGSVWGPLRSADLTIANERAPGLAIQVIEESTYRLPTSCTGTDISTSDMLGANGILGISSFLRDCGPACAARLDSDPQNPGIYYVSAARTPHGAVVPGSAVYAYAQTIHE